MRSLLLLIGFSAVALVIATSHGLSGTFCLGSDHGCMMINGDGLHLVDNKSVAKYNQLATTPTITTP
jgi:hypothetical protein